MTTTKPHAKGRDWWTTATKPDGGFVLIREDAIYSLWEALQCDEIELRDLRVWLACFELLERRCVADAKRTPRFTLDELHALVGGVGGQHLRRSLARLSKLDFIRWSEHKIELLGSRRSSLVSTGRLIPFPRRLLRSMVAKSHPSVVATTLGHAIRCLYFRGGKVVSGGYCKSSWVSETFGISLRAVKEARSELVSRGVLLPHTCDQTRLNRFGLPTVVNLFWKPTTQSAPPTRKSTTQPAPPSKHSETSYRKYEHQKPVIPPTPNGVLFRTRRRTLPTDFHVVPDDLKSPHRLVSLFYAAESRGWVKRCEADKLDFFAAAAHARRVGTRNMPGLFAHLVRHRRFQFISQEDEDDARRVIRCLRHPLAASGLPGNAGVLQHHGRNLASIDVVRTRSNR